MTIKGALPPSSSDTRLTVAALLAASAVPTAVDPAHALDTLYRNVQQFRGGLVFRLIDFVHH